MSVVFESRVKMSPDGHGWYIELKDRVDGRVVNCQDLEEFEKNIEEFGLDYGGRIDEVRWSSDSNVYPEIINEIRDIRGLTLYTIFGESHRYNDMPTIIHGRILMQTISSNIDC